MPSGYSQLDRATDEMMSTQRYGLPALFEELALEGISEDEVLSLAGVSSSHVELGYQERTALLRAAQQLSSRSETALLAGQRQKISYYGAYSFALATCNTMLDALRTGRQFLHLSGFVLHVSFHYEDGRGVWRSHQPESLGSVLPFVAEYWRSSQTTLFSQVLGRPFPSLHMSFPYPAPQHAKLYSEILRCPVTFNSDVMEWRFDASIMHDPCENADPVTAKLCERYCERFIAQSGVESDFQRSIIRVCVDPLALRKVTAPAVAESLNISVRTLYRRLDQEGISFQSILDRLYRSVAVDYLQNTEFSVEDIASRCGYQDVSNFRKAFKRWTGATPSSFRD